MKVKSVSFLVIGIVSVLFLPGCRYYCWLKEVYNQGEPVDQAAAIARYHWRARHVYDQLSPLAHFDVLWLSQELRAAYVCVHAQKHCLCQEHVRALEKEQRDQAAKTVSFYVLSAITPYLGNEDLAHKNSEWSMRLNVANYCYGPSKIEEVELPTEYKMFFGKEATRFKRTYKVDFPGTDTHGNTLIRAGIPAVQLCFHRDDRFICMQWCLDAQARVVRVIDNDPDVLSFPFHIP